MPNWFIRDTIDFEKSQVERDLATPYTLMMPGDNGAHTWCVTILDGGESVDITGKTVQAFFTRSDGVTVAVIGEAIGSVARVTFPRDVYLHRGALRGVMRLGDSVESVTDPVTTLMERTFYVREGIGDHVVAPENTFPTMEELIEAIQNVTDIVYPVGSIYLSTNDTNPGTIFSNTTWVRIKDTFLLAAGDTYAAGATGGEAEHTLTLDEVPAHDHGNYVYRNGTQFGWAELQPTGSHVDMAMLNSVCGGQAHNNMPPYLAVYVWQRTA